MAETIIVNNEVENKKFDIKGKIKKIADNKIVIGVAGAVVGIAAYVGGKALWAFLGEEYALGSDEEETAAVEGVEPEVPF